MTSSAHEAAPSRRYPIGAEPTRGGVSFRVWAPAREYVSVVTDDGIYPLDAEGNGYFSGLVTGFSTGANYHFDLDNQGILEADPASRFQPAGPKGPSQIIQPSDFIWSDQNWTGLTPQDQVIYELHVGTFTPEGTWAAAGQRLQYLRDLGVTVIEMMPVNEFLGSFGWGYDGVLLFAPTRLYGSPDDLRTFVDTAHALGIGVILDVVYNHFGPGDRFDRFAPSYFKSERNDWGRSLNLDGNGCDGVRTYFICNAVYWIEEFHFDGLRIDATQALEDKSETHLVAEIANACRRAAGVKNLYLLAENEPQDANLVRETKQGGLGMDAVWNDDFHHSAKVALTGRREAYFHDYQGHPQEFVSAAKYGYLFQGQRYDWQNKSRGKPTRDLLPANFVHFLENHDQIANSASGKRIHQLTSRARLRAMTALLILAPQTPMLFQGQEFSASTPFLYFSDAAEDFSTVRDGRIAFLTQFASFRDQETMRNMP
jgi:maltooligosyltrehalose trehalohydrolase